MSLVATALDRIKTLLNYTISASGFTEAELQTLKGSVDSERTSLNTAIVALATSKQAVQTAELNYQTYLASYQSAYDKAVANLDKMRQIAENNERTYANLIEIKQVALESAQANLELKQAPARSVDLAAYLSRIKEARTNLELAQINYENALIKSPMSGVITKINYEIGEQITVGSPVISLIAKSGLEIKADVPESDIIKIDIGDPVEITLDAYGEEQIFQGSVSFIDPAETVIQDVVYYGIKIQFDNDIQSVKPGMTANSIIETARKENVLQIPIRAIKQRNGDKVVDILENKEVIQKEVVTGLRGDNYMEIISGLEVGQEVITFIKDN
jgi:HlyD family secretion protein